MPTGFVAMVALFMSFLEVRDLRKSFVSPEGGHGLVVDVENFSIAEGELCGMRGESGSGKTTFLHLLAGILRPDSGSIVLDGSEVSKLTESARDHLRASSIGYVFQSFNLLQGFSCLENPSAFDVTLRSGSRYRRRRHSRRDTLDVRRGW